MIDTELIDLIRKAYKAGRRNALKQDETNFNDFINKYESKLKLFTTPVVSKSFTYKDVSKVAEELANEYSGDNKDPVWQDIRQDGIKAIKAFISKYF